MNSDFQITETPTLHFVANGDEQQLSIDLQARLEESLAQAEGNSDVTAAVAATQVAESLLRKSKTAERALHQHSRDLSIAMTAATDNALASVIESASEEKPVFPKLGELIGLETRIRYTNRALERLVEHLIPLAQIVYLRADSHELLTRVRAIEKVAQERAERVLGQLREAVSEEMVLPIDMSKGVAGALLAQAGGLKRLALQQAENADRLDKSYTARVSGTSGIKENQ